MRRTLTAALAALIFTTATIGGPDTAEAARRGYACRGTSVTYLKTSRESFANACKDTIQAQGWTVNRIIRIERDACPRGRINSIYCPRFTRVYAETTLNGVTAETQHGLYTYRTR